MMQLLKSFSYAARGVWFCIRNERNFRIHLIVASYALGFAPMFSLTRTQWSVLILTIAFMLAAEAVNTAIEHTVDFKSYDNHPTARIAKDSAAAAVLVFSVSSVAIGILLFGDPDMLLTVFDKIMSSRPKQVFIILSLIVSLLFVFKCGHKKHT